MLITTGSHMPARIVKLVSAVGVTASMLALAGCAAEGSGSGRADVPRSSPSAPSAHASAGAAAEGITVTAPVGSREIEYTVGPLVNDGDLSILPVTAVDVTQAPAGQPVDISSLWGGLFPGAHGVRLLDADEGTVEDAATSSRGTGYYTTGSLTVAEEPVVMHIVFGAQSASTIDALIPFAGLAADVPVVDLDDLAESDGGAEQAELLTSALDELVSDRAQVTVQRASLETFQQSIDGAVDTAVTPEQVVITVNADVLFDVDQATITTGARAALMTAAQQFAGYGAGSLTVVGHTDDVGEEDDNEDLSVRRAQAVADHLTTVADLSPYTVSVEGRGESQPRAAGTTAEDRALNRRVELLFEPGVPTQPVAPSPTDFVLPDSVGPSAQGGDGVTLTGRGDWLAHVSLAGVVKRGGLLIGEVHIRSAEGEVVAPGEMFSVGSLRSPRGELTSHQMYTPANLTLVSGDQRFYPVDYMPHGDPSPSRIPLAEINVRQDLRKGETLVITVVWPAAAAGENGRQVVLDHFNPKADDPVLSAIRPPFRLTDIPVTT